jgi:hypothetical protein
MKNDNKAVTLMELAGNGTANLVDIRRKELRK